MDGGVDFVGADLGVVVAVGFMDGAEQATVEAFPDQGLALARFGGARRNPLRPAAGLEVLQGGVQHDVADLAHERPGIDQAVAQRHQALLNFSEVDVYADHENRP